MTADLTGPPITVLLVEDNPGDARLILEQLRELPAEMFDLERVDRLEPALARLRQSAVDVILLDLGLPDSSGLATFERTRKAAPDYPIVVISGLDDERLALQAVQAGAQDYLVKGRIESSLLTRVMRYAIARKKPRPTSPPARLTTGPSWRTSPMRYLSWMTRAGSSMPIPPRWN